MRQNNSWQLAPIWKVHSMFQKWRHIWGLFIYFSLRTISRQASQVKISFFDVLCGYYWPAVKDKPWPHWLANSKEKVELDRTLPQKTCHKHKYWKGTHKERGKYGSPGTAGEQHKTSKEWAESGRSREDRHSSTACVPQRNKGLKSDCYYLIYTHHIIMCSGIPREDLCFLKAYRVWGSSSLLRGSAL